MITFDNDATIFFKQPISGTLMALALLSLAYPAIRGVIRRAKLKRAAPLIARKNGERL
jgi:putative tricarboxylic transport membrane protein